jgi:hypothetical protein
MRCLVSDKEPGRGAPAASGRLRWVSLAAAVWALAYALYRAYYAAGGTFGMFGVPASEAQWRFVNGVGAAILLVVAVAPLAMLAAWPHPALRPFLLALCWVMTVGAVMHALVDVTQRVLSLTGRLALDYPFWASVDRRQADLQDLLFNEPWFLLEGLLWGAIAWFGGLRHAPRARWWLASALVAVLGLTLVGLLSATGVIGKVIVG